MPTTTLILIPVLGGFITGILALVAVLWLAPRERDQWREMPSGALADPRRFTFREGYLVDHSDNIGFLLPAPIDHLTAWNTLADTLSDIDETIPNALEGLRTRGQPFKIEGMFGRDRVIVFGRRDGEDLRLTVATAEEREDAVRIDRASLRAMQDEIATLAAVSATSPVLSWAVDGEGQVVWSNTAYVDRITGAIGEDAARGWPMHALFPEPDDAPPGRTRRKCRDRDGTEHWFEVTTNAPDGSGLRYAHATPLDAVIKAEDSLRNFIQTLTKSFAFLPTGLAIFDRQGQLTLFNPALMDMTGLDGAWLSRRPRLAEFFDALRDRQKLPEPRDYKAWRDSLADIGRTAGRGTYTETWTLPNGATYRVTGRPQGDGAVTLMLEDVSADVTANRTHRAEREMMMGLLDGMDDALLVFDPDGTRVLANSAARIMWSSDGAEDTMLPGTLDGCVAFWKTLSHPNPLWGELRDIIRNPRADRGEWTETVERLSGDELTLRIWPQANGRVALTFRPVASDLLHVPTAPSTPVLSA